MTSPKAALEAAKDHLYCRDDDDDVVWKRECALEAILKAAIPVAELESQAMKLLERYGVFVGIQHDSPDYLKWRNERARLLVQWEELK